MVIQNMNYRYGKKVVLLMALALSLIGLMFVFLFARQYTGTMNFHVSAILNQLGIWNTPTWLLWVLAGIGAASAVVATLTGIGIVAIPGWAASAIAGADSASA